MISRREARLLRLWRAAPQAVADEMLALLSALSPHLREARETDDLITILPSSPGAADRADEPRRNAGSKASRRRRHGAVWDPADIVRAAKGEPRG